MGSFGVFIVIHLVSMLPLYIQGLLAHSIVQRTHTHTHTHTHICTYVPLIPFCHWKRYFHCIYPLWLLKAWKSCDHKKMGWVSGTSQRVVCDRPLECFTVLLVLTLCRRFKWLMIFVGFYSLTPGNIALSTIESLFVFTCIYFLRHNFWEISQCVRLWVPSLQVIV